jgi:uncharacterized membrane protein
MGCKATHGQSRRANICSWLLRARPTCASVERSIAGNVTEALSAASELQFVDLAEALELTLLLADEDPEKFGRAAGRWTARFLQEVPNVDVRESQAVLALLAAIPVNRLAAVALAELLSRRRSCEWIAEALVRWARAA